MIFCDQIFLIDEIRGKNPFVIVFDMFVKENDTFVKILKKKQKILLYLSKFSTKDEVFFDRGFLRPYLFLYDAFVGSVRFPTFSIEFNQIF